MDLDLVLTRAVDPARTDALTGVVAMAAGPDGVLYQGAAGLRDVASEAPMTTDSVFWLASMTKAVTSVAAMQLVERGLLSLDAPAADILPQLGGRMVLEGFDAAGAPRLRPARTEATLRQLLTHTAGYGYDFTSATLGRARRALGLPARAAGWDDLAREPLLFDPGTDWMYGIATDLVGKLVEAVSGEALGDYLHTHIFAPLAMADTGFEATADMAARAVTLQARTPQGGLAPANLDPTAGRGFLNGGGGLRGTAPDYIRFLRMLLNGGILDGARVLQADSVAAMSCNQIGALVGRPLPAILAHMSNHADFFPGMVQKWGLGFLINTEPSASGRSAGGLCWAGLGNTYFWIDPTRRIAGVVLCQLLPFADPAAMALLWAFEREVYAAHPRG